MAGIIYDSDIQATFGGANRAGGLLKSASTWNTVGKWATGIQTIANIGDVMGGYNQNAASADALAIRAKQVELQALQKGNILREKLYGSISNSFASYGARGVDIGSGTPMANAEMTMKEGGDDIEQIRKNAKIEAESYRAQAGIMRRAGNFNLISGLVGALVGGASQYAGFLNKGANYATV